MINPESSRRYPTVDLLRLVAITMTMLTHTPSISRALFLLRPFSHGLWLGVDLFMLISGWLLGGQLLRESKGGSFAPLRFYVKRWLRTLPPYWFMLIALYFGSHSDFSRPLSASVILSHAAFLQGYTTYNRYLVSWSLCVEEHFYLLLPALIYMLMRWPRLRAVLSLVVMAETLSICLRTWAYYEHPSSVDVPQLSVLRCHGLFLGLLLAWINLQRPELWRWMGKWIDLSLVLGLIGTLLIMASTTDPPSAWLYVAVPTLGTWTLALVFLACVHEQSFASRIDFIGLQYLGGLTYAMYLIHTVIPRSWLGGSGAGSLASAVWRMLLVIVLSILLHHLVERPGLRFRRWVLQRRSFGAPSPATCDRTATSPVSLS